MRGPAPPRAAHRGANTDVSLRGGAALPSRLGRGQRRLPPSGAQQKRDTEPEQPPPWRVSPSGQHRRRWDASGPPNARRSGRAPTRRPARGPADPGPRPRSPSGFLRAPRAWPAPLALVHSVLGGRLPWGARKASLCLTLLLFLPPKSNFWKSSSPSVSSCRKFRSRRGR